MSNGSRAFTLIELLVVIAIIGVLSSVVLASLNSARDKAMDAKRSSDMNQVITALELFYDANGRYPDSISTVDPKCDRGYCLNTIVTNYLVPAGYLPAAPQDPKYENDSNNYRYCGAKGSSGNRQKYLLLRYSSKEGGLCHPIGIPNDGSDTSCGGAPGTPGNWYSGYPSC
jgi:prepilin-type N-terminal cleavage/methylation domain-containing protein